MRIMVKRQETLTIQTQQPEISTVAPASLKAKREVLVAIDGTGPSKRLVDYVSETASSLSAKVILLYSMPGTDVPQEFLKFARIERISNPKEHYMRWVAERDTSDFVEQLKVKGIEYELVYVEGSPVQSIKDIAESRDLKFVVVELRGFQGIRRLRGLGSYIRRVIGNSPVPVVTIPTTRAAV